MGVVTPYAPQVWVDNVTPDNAAHMNPIEQGLANAVQKPTGLLDGEVPVWDSVNGGWERSSVKKPQLPGLELAYTEYTAIVNITATTEAGANTIVTAPAVTFDGATPAWVEFYAPWIDNQSSFALMLILFQDGVSIGKIAEVYGAASEVAATVTPKRKITPAAGARTYSIRAHMNVASSGQVQGGLGGAGNFMPGFIRISRA